MYTYIYIYVINDIAKWKSKILNHFCLNDSGMQASTTILEYFEYGNTTLPNGSLLISLIFYSKWGFFPPFRRIRHVEFPRFLLKKGGGTCTWMKITSETRWTTGKPQYLPYTWTFCTPFCACGMHIWDSLSGYFLSSFFGNSMQLSILSRGWRWFHRAQWKGLLPMADAATMVPMLKNGKDDPWYFTSFSMGSSINKVLAK